MRHHTPAHSLYYVPGLHSPRPSFKKSITWYHGPHTHRPQIFPLMLVHSSHARTLPHSLIKKRSPLFLHMQRHFPLPTPITPQSSIYQHLLHSSLHHSPSLQLLFLPLPSLIQLMSHYLYTMQHVTPNLLHPPNVTCGTSKLTPSQFGHVPAVGLPLFSVFTKPSVIIATNLATHPTLPNHL